MTVRPRRWLMLALAPIVAVTFLAAAPVSPASAEPGDGTSATPDESAGKQNQTLDELIESSNRRFVQAKGAVAKSTAAQKALAVKIKAAEARRNELIPEVNAIAAQQYRFGQLNAASFLLGSQGSTDFWHKAVSLEEINSQHDRKLAELNQAIDEVTQSKAALDAEVKNQKKNLVVMQKQKEAANEALDLVGGNSLTQGKVLAKSPIAKAAPRNSEGGFSPESCTVSDPTTNGCITARTLNMYKEVKKAGFDRFVGCHRDGGPFEHPKGRACDWSLQDKGFAVAHNADMKEYATTSWRSWCATRTGSASIT